MDVRVQEGEVHLIPTNSQLKPVNIGTNQEVEVSEVSVIYNSPSTPGVGGPSNSPSDSSSQSYFILVLKLYNYDELYIGTEASVRDRTRCSFGGGGHCLPDDRVSYQKLLGPFASRQEAQEALCQNVTERKVFPDAVLKGNWGLTGTWYGLSDETVSFDCSKTGADARASTKRILFFCIVIALGIGFVLYRFARPLGVSKRTTT